MFSPKMVALMAEDVRELTTFEPLSTADWERVVITARRVEAIAGRVAVLAQTRRDDMQDASRARVAAFGRE